ncbi:hypothetical protein GCM10009616_21130 [Microlunatus lacustris]
MSTPDTTNTPATAGTAAAGAADRSSRSSTSRARTGSRARSRTAESAGNGAADGATTGAAAAVSSAPVTEPNLFVAGCDKVLEAWGVTRQFEFGQFVMLYHREMVGGKEFSLPVMVLPDGAINQVTSTASTSAASTGSSPVGTTRVATGAAAPARRVTTNDGTNDLAWLDDGTRSASLLETLGGVPLDLLGRVTDPVALLAQSPVEKMVADLSPVLSGGSVTVDSKSRYPQLNLAAAEALKSGLAVTALATNNPVLEDSDPAQHVMVRLIPETTPVTLTENEIDTALATGQVLLPRDQRVAIDLVVAASLLSGQPTLLPVRTGTGELRLYDVRPSRPGGKQPAAEKFVVHHLGAFLVDPVVPSLDATPVRVQLNAAAIRALRTNKSATVAVNGVNVEFRVNAAAMSSRSAASSIDRTRGDRARALPSMARAAAQAIARMARAAPLRDLPRGGPFEPGLDPFDGAGGGLAPKTGATPDTRPGHPRMDGGFTDPFWDDVGLSLDPDAGPWPGLDGPIPELELDYGYLHWLEWLERNRNRNRNPLPPGSSAGTATLPGGSASAGLYPNVKPTPLPVALLLPWRQRWMFEGCSRGNLLSSIALAPGETRTIRMYSWERTAKALEQSTETETELSQDFTSTTRDTEDVFREMTSSQDFNAQAHGEVDASYSTGFASITAGAGGSLQNGSALEQVCRVTSSTMSETVRRASARVRSRRITKITESQESIRGDEVIRQVNNPNRWHTLTLDYYEQLAHYTITTAFVPAKVKTVVMVPNPLRGVVFDNLTVRTNETALRQALLTPDLGGGFAAARLLASYQHAWEEAERTAARAKEVAELDRQRVEPPASDTNAPKAPDNPHKTTLEETLSRIKTSAVAVLGAEINAALTTIAVHGNVTAEMRKKGQMWLWRRLVETRLGLGFINALAQLRDATANPLTPDHARALVDAIPTGFPGLKDLHSLKDNEKEDGALATEFHARMGAPWDWAWWSGEARKNGLYDPDDNGIAAACERLVKVLRDYDAKESEGGAVLAQQEMVNKANQEQAAANWVDKLEMKYGLDEIADAREREDALLAHLNGHADYYRYVLFQALPPGEQLAALAAAAPQLRVGFFEPRVVAHSGELLAVPLSPTAKSELETLVKGISDTLKKAADEAIAIAEAIEADDVILPTPGLTVETSLGECSAAEPHQVSLNELELKQLRAALALDEAEGDRRAKQLATGDLTPFRSLATPLAVGLHLHDDKGGGTTTDGSNGSGVTPSSPSVTTG